MKEVSLQTKCAVRRLLTAINTHIPKQSIDEDMWTIILGLMLISKGKQPREAFARRKRGRPRSGTRPPTELSATTMLDAIEKYIIPNQTIDPGIRKIISALHKVDKGIEPRKAFSGNRGRKADNYRNRDFWLAARVTAALEIIQQHDQSGTPDERAIAFVNEVLQLQRKEKKQGKTPYFSEFVIEHAYRSRKSSVTTHLHGLKNYLVNDLTKNTRN